MSATVAHSVCPHDCASACTLDVEISTDGSIGRVHGSPGNAYTAGVVCAKVARYAERVYHPGRLTQPLRRVGRKDGPGTADDYAPVSWDQALDEVAEALTRAAQRHGPETVWLYNYAGTMGHVQRDSIQRLRNVMGYSQQLNTICSSLMGSGMKAGLGIQRGVDPREFGESDLIVIWGSNPVHTQVNLMHHVSRARKDRGARLVVVDPYRTATARQADQHIMPRPGTDGALACAVMHVLFRDGFADREYMAEYTDVPDELEAHVAARTPEWAAGITGLGAAEIEAFAREYGATQRVIIRMGYGFTRSRNGAASLHAVSCLPAITGAWRYPGGGAYGSGSGVFRLDMTMIQGADAATPRGRSLDMSRLGPILTGEADALGDGPPVTAMMVQSSNPAIVAPESAKVREGMLGDGFFLCVHEQFLTDTAQLADIVLPATTFLEHDDLYTSYGQPFIQLGPKAIDPIGEARCNHDTISDLAGRLGAAHPGFDMDSWAVIDWTLKHSGYPGVEALKSERWIDCRPDFETAHFLNGFDHADGKFRFKPDWKALGPDHAVMPPLPDHFAVIDEGDDDHPFRLITAPSRHFLNSSFTETPTSREKEDRPTALIHPEDCAVLGIDAGDRVRVGNRRGSVVVHADPFDGLQRGVVVVESVWPNTAFEEGIGINALTSADPGPPFGGAVFHDTAIWVRAA